MALLPCTFNNGHEQSPRVEDEFNVPIALSAFRDKGPRLWSFKKKEKPTTTTKKNKVNLS